jgi:hypothetical protein
MFGNNYSRLDENNNYNGVLSYSTKINKVFDNEILSSIILFDNKKYLFAKDITSKIFLSYELKEDNTIVDFSTIVLPGKKPLSLIKSIIFITQRSIFL